MKLDPRSAINFGLFQAVWWASILGAAAGVPWLGPVAFAPALAIHLVWIAADRDRFGEIALLVAAAVVGFAADSALVLVGLMDFPDAAAWGRPSTVWMAVMWSNLATTPRASLGFLRGRPAVAAVFGGIGGALAYLAGDGFGAISLAAPTWASLGSVGVLWAIATPLLVRAAGLVPAARRATGPPTESMEPTTP